MNEVRSLVVGAVDMVKCRLKGDGQAALAARNELEEELQKSKFLETAPFRTMSLIFRYGKRDDLNPDIGDVDTKRSVLPLAVELDGTRLKSLSQDQLQEEFRTVMIEVLCDVAANFDLPFEFLDALRRPSKSHN